MLSQAQEPEDRPGNDSVSSQRWNMPYYLPGISDNNSHRSFHAEMIARKSSLKKIHPFHWYLHSRSSIITLHLRSPIKQRIKV